MILGQKSHAVRSSQHRPPSKHAQSLDEYYGSANYCRRLTLKVEDLRLLSESERDPKRDFSEAMLNNEGGIVATIEGQ